MILVASGLQMLMLSVTEDAVEGAMPLHVSMVMPCPAASSGWLGHASPAADACSLEYDQGGVRSWAGETDQVVFGWPSSCPVAKGFCSQEKTGRRGTQEAGWRRVGDLVPVCLWRCRSVGRWIRRVAPWGGQRACRIPQRAGGEGGPAAALVGCRSGRGGRGGGEMTRLSDSDCVRVTKYRVHEWRDPTR